MTEHRRTRLRRPPIREALVEFRFAPTNPDATIFGRLYDRVSADYPQKQQQHVVQAAVQPRGPGASTVAIDHAVLRMQFLSDDGHRLVSVGQDVLSAHVLGHYDGWPEFRPRVEAALRAYSDVAAPAGIRRIGVRYLNHVSPPDGTEGHGQLFTIGPPELDVDGLEGATYLLRRRFSYPDAAQLSLTHAPIEDGGKMAGYLLDLDVFDEQVAHLDRAMERVDELHERLVRAFFSLVTERARELFDVE